MSANENENENDRKEGELLHFDMDTILEILDFIKKREIAEQKETEAKRREEEEENEARKKAEEA